jgi:hypothetical protein
MNLSDIVATGMAYTGSLPNHLLVPRPHSHADTGEITTTTAIHFGSLEQALELKCLSIPTVIAKNGVRF